MAGQFDWDDLQSFLAVARSGRLTVAARRMGVDHTTLGRRLQSLERALGANLFERHATGYSLTAQGESLLASAEAMEGLAMTIMEDLAGSAGSLSGAVRIGTPDGFGSFFLAPRIGQLATRHPDLEVQLVAMPRLFSLSKREADIAISLAQPDAGRLHGRKLTDYELGLYAARSYVAASPPIASVADLPGHRFISYIDDLLYTPELDYLPQISRDIRPQLKSASLVAQFRAVEAGAGIAVLPCFLVNDHANLVRLLPADVSLIRSFWLLIHSDLRHLSRIRVTAEFIAEEVRRNSRLFRP
jgi:DNA-binding transcriptional LysR family regulator